MSEEECVRTESEEESESGRHVCVSVGVCVGERDTSPPVHRGRAAAGSASSVLLARSS
jgi:hypothetical protein